MLINILMSKTRTFMTLIMTVITISTTTHNNTRVMRNTPAIIMKKILMNLLRMIRKTIVASTTKRMKASYVKKMSQILSLMMVLNNDMRINLLKYTLKRLD